MSEDLFKKLVIDESIVVPPEHFTTKEKYILSRLEKKENICTKYGFVKSINSINHISDGKMYESQFTGSVIYEINYTVNVCNPEINSVINCEIIQFIPEDEIIVASNPPLFVHVIIQENKEEVLREMNKGDNINIEILAKRIKKDDSKITIVGKYLKTC